MNLFSVLHYAAAVKPGEDQQSCARCGQVLQAGPLTAAWAEGTPVVVTIAGGGVQAVPHEGIPEGVFFPSCAPAQVFGSGPGPVIALEPSTEPEHPLRASDAQPLLAKNIA